MAPGTASGRFATRLLCTVEPISEVAVSSWLASAITVTLSETAPSSIWTSKATVASVCTVTPSREYFFRPGPWIITEYRPGGRFANE